MKDKFLINCLLIILKRKLLKNLTQILLSINFMIRRIDHFVNKKYIHIFYTLKYILYQYIFVIHFTLYNSLLSFDGCKSSTKVQCKQNQ